MKPFMLVVNVVVFLISLIGIVGHLVMGQFGTAWLCVIPLVYSWWNCLAIEEE